MSPTPRREPEDMPGAENAEEPIAVGNELESLELNSGDLVSCVDEVAKPGHDIPVSHVWELCTFEIKTATQSSVVRLSDVSYFECSLSGIHEETPRAIDSAIIAEECSENRVQKYNRPEHEPHSGGTSESSLSVAVLDINQEAQDNGESKDMMGLFICTERDMQDHVIDCEASDNASSVGIQSRRNRKSRKPHSLVKNSPGSRKSKCVCDTSHVEENSKWVKGYGTRNIELAEDAEPNVIAVKQEFNLKNTPTSFTELHLQCVDKTEPSPSKYSSLNFSTSSGIQHKKQPMYIDPRLPKGWTRSVVQRKKGASAGKFDVYIFSPEGKKFRSRRELKSFLLGTDLFLNADDFDFSVNGKGGTVEELGLNENTVQDSDLIDEGEVNGEIPLEYNSENFRDETKDKCYKNVPKMQEDSENEVADKLIQPSSRSLEPNVGMSRRVTSAYFASNGVSKRISNRLHDSDVRNKFKSVHSSSFVQGEPTLVYKRTDNEDGDETVPPQFDDKIFQADVSDIVCKAVPCAKTLLKSKIKTKWTPPRSPFNLVQEHLYHDPWQLLVATVFLNRTQGEVALPSLFKFFAAWPTPESIINASQLDIAQFLRPLGLQETRAYAIKRMSQDYITKDWRDVKELFGIGKYGSDSYKIFCLNQWKSVRPSDLKLKNYVNWLWTNHRSLGLC